MGKRTLVAIAAVGLVAAFAAAPAGAQEYPPDQDFITVDDTVVVVGQSITVTSGTYVPGSAVSHTFASQPVNLGTATAGAGGVATLTAAVPDVAPGRHTITATGADDTGGTLRQSVTITVVAPADDDDDRVAAAAPGRPAAPAEPAARAEPAAPAAPAAPARALPRTGDESLPWLRVGAILVALGGVLVLLARRRHESAVQA